MALATAPLNEGVSEQITGIVPRKSINEIGKIVSDSSENILLQLTPNSINVNVAGTTFSSKLIEGKFPDYEQVIPGGESSTLSINKKDLSGSLSRVSVLSSEKFRGVRMITSENQINISANNPEKEQAEESINCSYAGESIDHLMLIISKKFYPQLMVKVLKCIFLVLIRAALSQTQAQMTLNML